MGSAGAIAGGWLLEVKLVSPGAHALSSHVQPPMIKQGRKCFMPVMSKSYDMGNGTIFDFPERVIQGL